MTPRVDALPEYAEAVRRLVEGSGEARDVPASRARAEFLANISHEVRTPLTAILGYTELATRRCAAIADDETAGYLEVVRRNGEQLLGLIGDLLELSRNESGDADVELNLCPLANLLAEVADGPRALAEDKGLALTVEVAPTAPEVVRTDPARLRRILHHLLGNAVKFTERGGVCLRLRHVAGPAPARLEFEVSDTGLGMGPGEVARLFQPFYRGEDARLRALGGAGLGLAISQRLARQIGGSLTASSTPGSGSVFTLTIPADVVGQEPDVRAPVSPPEPAGFPERHSAPVASGAATSSTAGPRVVARVLLAEDNRDNQRVIALRLAVAGAQVTVAPNGRTAVDLARAARDAGTPFDLVLMDMQMPVLDGYEATRMLRAEGFCTPVVALTAYAMPEDRQECLRFGCDGYVPKPIDWPVLLALIARLLESARSGQQARLGA
jgi:CheY-like chemotaxis protein